jgi:glyoxylase I family protein
MSLPLRLHHNAYVARDLEATRHFYEDILGFPLLATWTEVEDLFGETREYCHVFFGLADGSALSFFQFADPDANEEFASRTTSPFVHIALAVDAETHGKIAWQLESNGIPVMEINHGYCRSLYVNDPDGLLVEFTLDPPDVAVINRVQAARAHDELKRWLAGDRRSNNDWRPGTEG